MKHFSYPIASFALCAITTCCVGQVLPFTHYTPDSEISPLPSADVWGITQDRLGSMWFAIYSSGLVRYDGHSMEVFTKENGLRDLTVRAVAQDSVGHLWVASDGGLSVSVKPVGNSPGEQIEFATQYRGVELVDVAVRRDAMDVDKFGRLWVGTESSGIYRYSISDEQLHVERISTALDSEHQVQIESIVARRDGSIWATAESPTISDLLIFDQAGAVFRRLSDVSSLPSSFTTLYEDHNGVLWGGTSDGHLFFVDEATPIPEVRYIRSPFSDAIESIHAESENTLWVAVQAHGLARIDLMPEPNIKVFSRINGLLSESIHDIAIDREDNIWLSQTGGISKLRSNYGAFRNLSSESIAGEQPILPGPAVSAVVVPSRLSKSPCALLVGTSGGLACVSGSGSAVHVRTENGIQSDLINGLILDSDDRLWIGTDNGIAGLSLFAPAVFPATRPSGIVRLGDRDQPIRAYRRTTIHSVSKARILLTNSVESTIEVVLLPGYYSLYLLIDNEWFVFRPSAGLPPTHYQTVSFDSRGRLIVGTRDHGLYRSKMPLSLASIRALESEPVSNVVGTSGIFGREITEHVFEAIWSTAIGGSPTNQVVSLITKDDLIFAGTPEGLFVLDGDPIFIAERLTAKDGLPADNVLSMAVSPTTGNLWVGTNGGLAEIDTRTRNVIRTVTKSDGLIDNEVWYLGSVFVDEDGVVYYGTAKGLSIYNPDLDRPNLVPAKPQITGVRYRQNGWGDNEFAIEYAALSFAREKEVEYKTRLIPYESEWSEPTKDHRIRYTNLPAFFADRDYTFELQASNGSGVWTEQALSYSFPVTPAWYVRWWALMSYLLLVGGGVLAYIRHKTRVQAEQLAQEREINERLRRIDRLKDEFLANTSHELRTPLNGIIGIAESMMDGVAGDLGHKAMSNIALIIGSGKRLANLVNDILDFSKLKERELELRQKAVDVSVLGDIVLRVSEPLIEGKNLVLKNTIPRDLSPALADEDRLQQILYNLIGNAIKFTHEGSVILSGRSGDGMIEVGVADTGIGIPKEKHDSIFQSFEQVDATTGREYGGTGLGLAVTRQLVELHGGSIRVESTENVGSTFLFTLPMADGEAEELEATEYLSRIAAPEVESSEDDEAASTARVTVAEGDEVNVLVVDDEPINQQVMANQLSVANYRVTQALNGKEALAALDGGTTFDIVLLDVMMPRMSGFEVCNRIRKKFLPSELPVIMVTAKNQVADLVEGLSAGANDYITKPISKSELLARIKTQLNLQRINQAYGRFVPREFLRYLNKESIIDVQLGDMVQKEMTIFVSDIRRFTTLSEKMTPEENFEFINAYLAQASPVIRDHGGFIDRYTGDAIMALFPEEADKAVQASIDTLRVLSDINEIRTGQGELPIEIGIGLHSGSLMLGIVGEQERAQGDIFSDAVNLANRIEGLSKLYGASLVVSEETLGRLASDRQYHERFLGKVQVKGKNEHVSVFEIYDGDPEHMIEMKLKTKEHFEQGLLHYFDREFTNASVCFKQVLDQNSADKTAALYLRRSAQFMIQGVPESWEGVEAVDVISEEQPVQTVSRVVDPSAPKAPSRSPKQRSVRDAQDDTQAAPDGSTDKPGGPGGDGDARVPELAGDVPSLTRSETRRAAAAGTEPVASESRVARAEASDADADADAVPRVDAPMPDRPKKSKKSKKEKKADKSAKKKAKKKAGKTKSGKKAREADGVDARPSGEKKKKKKKKRKKG